MNPTLDPSHELFQNYSRHYATRERRGRERLPAELERIKRDRLPRWIDEIPKDARILDAGCAQGHLLEALGRVGFSNLTGVDISAQLLAEARRRLPQDARLYEGDIRDWLPGVPAESFDLIFFHDVLEHLPRENTIEVLRQFYRILAPGGRMSVRVPNMSCLIATNCMAIDFTHVTHFTEFSLIQVLEAGGFAPDRIFVELVAPRLFWSWRQPHKAFFRLLNRARWYLNRILHRGLYFLVDFASPSSFDPNLVVVVRK